MAAGAYKRQSQPQIMVAWFLPGEHPWTREAVSNTTQARWRGDSNKNPWKQPDSHNSVATTDAKQVSRHSRTNQASTRAVADNEYSSTTSCEYAHVSRPCMTGSWRLWIV
ncbi:hypothetical protein PCH_Pc21g21090 [Penicillium rubens Wisconsin 54-1255]|uniref:Uncharacterized protein n=1 Tax=Penicillium rubens (strain ATCC 28089 / DSM 1075 / NRRL 1951 / Wisconsin 54-1255) TaxID=500485 RepID=B6HLG0_PENRW|nr:hypothetical protein PCH_Pc21g21090 [Penicillium rubens Wisconsin 54-1255]